MKWLDDPGCWVFTDGSVAVPKCGSLFYPKISCNSDNYPGVNINGRHKTLHRLIARAFIPNPDNKPQVDHIDRNRGNYSLDNLRWVTQSENQRNTLAFDRSVELYGVSGAVDTAAYRHEYNLRHEEKRKLYYQQNRERLLANMRKYHAEHREQINERHRSYRLTCEKK